MLTDSASVCHFHRFSDCSIADAGTDRELHFEGLLRQSQGASSAIAEACGCGDGSSFRAVDFHFTGYSFAAVIIARPTLVRAADSASGDSDSVKTKQSRELAAVAVISFGPVSALDECGILPQIWVLQTSSSRPPNLNSMPLKAK